MIEFKNVSLSYNSKLVLKKINLTINDGEFCVLIGASGCGKTTLLKLINKLNKVSSGKVLIDGEDINKLSLRKLPGKIGYVVQEAGLFPHLSVAENIALSLELAEYPKNESPNLSRFYIPRFGFILSPAVMVRGFFMPAK